MLALIEKCNILVFASHSNDLIKKLCNKALWLEKGEIKAFGKVDEIIELYQQDVERA